MHVGEKRNPEGKRESIKTSEKREGNNWLLKGALLYEGIIGRVSVSHMKVLYRGDTKGQG